MYQFQSNQPGYVPFPAPAPRRQQFGWKSVLLVVVLVLLLSGGSFFLGVKAAPFLGNTPLIGNGSIDGYYLYTDDTTVELLHIVSATQTIQGSNFNLQIDEQGEQARADGNTYICNSFSASMSPGTYLANIAGSVLTWGSMTGTFNGNTITFTLPAHNGTLQNEVFTRASVDQYNTALQKFKSTYQGSTGC